MSLQAEAKTVAAPRPHAAPSASDRKAPLSLSLKLGYSGGQFIDGVVNNAVPVFLLFYLTTVCGMSGALAGAALSLGIIVDAVMDPLIGALSDGWRSRLGRRLPFMMLSLPPLCLSLVLLFCLPRGAAPLTLFAWVAILSLILRICVSLFILPYQAVGAELSDDYKERSSIMAWRWGIGMLGAVMAIALGFGVFFAGKGGLLQRDAYPPFAMTLAALMLVGGVLAARATFGARARLHPLAKVSGWIGVRVFRELMEVFQNPSFCVLFVGALLFFVALGTNASLALHVNAFFWRLNGAETQLVTLALFGGLLAGAPLAGPFIGLLEKRSVLIIGMVGLIVALGAPVLLRLFHALPLSGPSLAFSLAGVMFLAGVLMAAAAIAFSSMMADAADEHEHLFGERREGLFFAGWSFAAKAATGIGALIAGLVLQFIHFPTNLANRGGASTQLPERMADLLALFYGPGAGVLFFASVIVCLYYRLDRQAHEAIMVDLEGRRRPDTDLILVTP